MGSTEERQSHIDLVRQHLLETFSAQDDPDGEVERCGDKIAKYLNQRALVLGDVIDQFGDKLTSQDVQERSKAVDILHYMFNALKLDTLTANDLTYLVEFLVDRLRDQHLVIPKVILCLQPIIKYENLPVGSCSKILNRIFEEANVQSHVHRVRRSYFSTVQHMFRTRAHLQDLQENCPNFLEHFIDTFAGEKDPRNLITLFNIIPTVLTHFPIKPLEEDLFEALACYFPIDFKPVARINSTETITREDLASALHICLSRTNLFSPFLIPLALEKLGSDLVNAKLDSLTLLTMCCEECYGPEDLNPFIKDIWHALRREIFLEANEQVESSCISFIRSAFKALSKDPSTLKQNIEKIFAECKHHLSEPELRMSQPASMVLLAIAESSEAPCAECISLAVPLLHQQFLENAISSNRKGILGIMKKFIATLSVYPSLSLGNLLGNWDEITGVWFTLLSHSDPEFVVLGLNLFSQLFDNKVSHTQRLGQLATSSFDLDSSYRGVLQEHLYNIINQPGVPADLATCTILVMERFAHIFPNEVSTSLAPKLLSVLDDHRADPGAETQLNSNILKALSECSVVPAIGRLTLSKLVELAMPDEQVSANAPRIAQITDCLFDAVDKICRNPKDKASEELVHFLCDELNSVKRFLKAGKCLARLGSRKAYLTLTKILENVMRAVDPSEQQRHVDVNWNEKSEDLEDFAKLLDCTPILLLEAFLAPLHPSISVLNKMQLIDVLIDKITSGISDPESEGQGGCNRQTDEDDGEAYVRLFAVLHNKLEESEFERILVRTEAQLQTCLFENADAEPGNKALNLLIWTTKSLSMKGSPYLNKWIDKLVSLLGTEKYGAQSAAGFATILSDSSSSLVPENHCTVKFLHKQRFFILSVPKLIAAYRDCSAGSQTSAHKMNYIKALSCQLKYVPKSVLHEQLENVIPLLIAGLSIVDSESEGLVSNSDQLVVLSSLTAIYELFTAEEHSSTNTGSTSSDANDAEEDSSLSSLVHYFRDLAPRLLELVSFTENMEIRIVALRCLQRCAKFPTHVIVPLKNKIVTALGNSLDDSKRLVRKEAVLTRNIWILSGAPGGL